MTFDPDEYLKKKSSGSFDPDAYLAAKTGIKPEQKKEPAWFDVPGKLKETYSSTVDKINREGELSGTGKQSELLGGAMSAMHGIAGGARAAGDVLSPIISNPLTKAIGSGFQGQMPLPQVSNKISEMAIPQTPEWEKKAGGYLKEHSEVGNRLGSTFDIASMLPVGKVAEPVASGVKAGLKNSIKSINSGIEDFGKTVKAGDLKMINAIAKKGYGKDLVEKKKNIINDAADFGVTHGNNEDGAIDALNKAQARFAKADEIGTALSNDPNTPLLNPVEIAMKGINSNIAPTGFRKQAQLKIQDVIDDMVADGHAQPVTLDKLIKAKQNLNADGKLFVNGPAGADTDPVGTSIRRKAYLNIVDAIGELSPEIKAMNTEGKRLLDVNSAFSSAASRVANHDAIGLTDFVLGGASLAHPGALAVAAPIFITKKLTGNGRGGNMIINIGRKLQGKKTNTIEATLASIPKREAVPKPVTPEPQKFLPLQMLPAPMIDNGAVKMRNLTPQGGGFIGEPQLPSVNDRIRSIGKFKDLGGHRLPTTFKDMSLEENAIHATEPAKYADDPFFASLKDPPKKQNSKEAKLLARAESDFGKLDESPVREYDPRELMSESQLADKAKWDYEQAGMKGLSAAPEKEISSVGASLRKRFGLGNGEVSFKDLPTDKKQKILDYTGRLEGDSESWNDLFDRGVLSEPFKKGEVKLHHDDVMEWINKDIRSKK